MFNTKEMHGSLSHFKATLQRKKERSETKDRRGFGRKNSYASKGKLADEFNLPKMSESEFTAFKLKLKSERKKQDSRDLLLLIGVFALITTLFILL